MFQDFILEHYSEDGNNFDDAILSFMELRQVCYSISCLRKRSEMLANYDNVWLKLSFFVQAMRRPSRTKNGVQLLLRYLGVLYFVERRFFPADRNIGVFFEW